MKTIPTNLTVSDYCQSLNSRDITVNKDYQRSDKVWPVEARSFLIETILLDYPMPKLSLHQRTDLKTRKTVKEIVDGQQRSMAILDFFNDKFPLSNKVESPGLRGKNYSQLDEEDQEKFLSYSLSIDLFANTSDKEIREVFRRMNSYTIPLNNEEKRHSVFQGEFKWYIYNLTKLYDNTLLHVGTFTEKQISRMADAKFFSDISYALINGIRTTTASTLDSAYKQFDVNFLQKSDLESKIGKAFDFIVNVPEIHKTPLMKPQVLYGLVLAVIEIHEPGSVRVDSRYFDLGPGRPLIDRGNYVTNLSLLAEALNDPDNVDGELKGFVMATSRTTNEIGRRSEVFKWLYDAMTRQNLI